MKNARACAIVSVVAAVVLLAVAIVAPRAAAAGWLIAFTYVAAFPLGALALVMIHRLTGGRWGDDLMPLLTPLSACSLLLLLLSLPLLIATPWLMSFTARIGEVTASVSAIYLNTPSFVARSVAGLVAFGVLGLVISRVSRAMAALGLLVYAVIISLLAIDWVLALDPPFHSTSFGASVAITQLLAAFALAATLDAVPTHRSDLGSLLLTATLGITYLDFMAVLVIWYGDVPTRTFWFLERLGDGWRWLAVATFALGSVIPIVLMMFAHMRQSRTGLRIAGGCVLIGLALYQTWLIAPVFGVLAGLLALIAAIAMAAFIAAAIIGRWHSILPARWRPDYGR